jgi:hypothetical protein
LIYTLASKVFLLRCVGGGGGGGGGGIEIGKELYSKLI